MESTTKPRCLEVDAAAPRFEQLDRRDVSKAHCRIQAIVLILLGVAVIAAGFHPNNATAEYGDVVINNHSEKSGMRPAVFPHWFHRVRFTCKVCHGDLGFQFKAGGNDITMLKIIDGQYCGACHNGQIAWSVENCDLCHTGTPALATQVHGSTLQKLVAPVSPPIQPAPEKPTATQKTAEGSTKK